MDETIEPLEYFRHRLAEELREQHMSQAELHRRTGVNLPFINRILHGHQQPTISTAARLAKGVGVTLHELLRPK